VERDLQHGGAETDQGEARSGPEQARIAPQRLRQRLDGEDGAEAVADKQHLVHAGAAERGGDLVGETGYAGGVGGVAAARDIDGEALVGEQDVEVQEPTGEAEEPGQGAGREHGAHDPANHDPGCRRGGARGGDQRHWIGREQAVAPMRREVAREGTRDEYIAERHRAAEQASQARAPVRP
jgi:hypothetical protein